LIPNIPELLLYVSGHDTERLVSPILLATILERAERFPEREKILPVAVARFELVVARFPEKVAILLLIPTIVPESADWARFVVK
jgi:hypothetical protein